MARHASPAVITASNRVVTPPVKFLTSMSNCHSRGHRRTGVAKWIRMSKSFGPPAGPVKPLDKDKAPLKTAVLSGPTLSAKVKLSASTAAEVVDKSISTFPIVDEKSRATGCIGTK